MKGQYFYEVYYQRHGKVGVYAANLADALEKFNAGVRDYPEILGSEQWNISAELQDDPADVGGWQ